MRRTCVPFSAMGRLRMGDDGEVGRGVEWAGKVLDTAAAGGAAGTAGVMYPGLG